MPTADQTDIYVTGVLYQTNAFPDSADDLFSIIDREFREIDGLEFQFLDINRADNRFSGGSTRQQLLIFMKDITYNSSKFLSDTNSNTLRNSLKTKLDNIIDVTYTDVEIRTSRSKT